jgi:CTP:molybdopterin cytidylyltransferase MocA
MGRDKALLDAEGAPFIERVVKTLLAGGARPIVVVLRRRAGRVADVALDAGAEVAINPAPDDPETGGPLSSLRRGMQFLPAGAAALLLHPVDHPRVSPETVAALITAFRHSSAPVVVPTFRGRSGHPVLLSGAIFPELLQDPLPHGARTVVRRHAANRCEVPVDDPGVVDDLDTPAAYRRAFPGGKHA